MSNTFLVDLKTTPKSVTAPVDIYLQGAEDFLIPLVFPDYEITVFEKQKTTFLGIPIENEAIKASYIGHAGVLLVDGKTGRTKYYEYGRYENPDIPGITRKVSMPDCKLIGGQISEKSLKKLLQFLSKKAGHGSSISGVVLRGNFYDNALAWLKQKVSENESPTKLPYNFLDNNCMTFVLELVNHLGLDSAWYPPAAPPNHYMELFQLTSVDLDYDPKLKKLEISE
ncbi:hypothetical protein [Halodesulfovibrio aestuarii]|uniref:Type VI secretion system effector TseH-like domain-containing protein n=1 Tax=Halodesulfovibrio aestuarii TaxID=126333 RepID=A0ABV4JVN8_9BACT